MKQLFQYKHREGDFVISPHINCQLHDFKNHSFWQGRGYNYTLFNNRPRKKWSQYKFIDGETIESFGVKFGQIINVLAWQYAIERKRKKHGLSK